MSRAYIVHLEYTSPDMSLLDSYDIWFGVPQSGDPATKASSYEM